MSNDSIKPGRWWYALAAFIFVAGVVCLGVYMYKTFANFDTGLTRMVAPGKQDFTFSKPGSYTIYHEYHSAIGNKVYSGDAGIPGLECELVSKSSGQKVTITPVTINEHYELNGKDGIAVFNFEITQPGVYEFSAYYKEGQIGTETVMALGKVPILKMIMLIFGLIGFFFLIIITSFTICIVVFIKRYSAKNRLKQTQVS